MKWGVGHIYIYTHILVSWSWSFTRPCLDPSGINGQWTMVWQHSSQTNFAPLSLSLSLSLCPSWGGVVSLCDVCLSRSLYLYVIIYLSLYVFLSLFLSLSLSHILWCSFFLCFVACDFNLASSATRMRFPPNFLISNSQTPFPPIMAKFFHIWAPRFLDLKKLMFVQGLFLGLRIFYFGEKFQSQRQPHQTPTVFSLFQIWFLGPFSFISS